MTSQEVSKEQTSTEEVTINTHEDIKHCGIIMPIAQMGEYSSDHWKEVKNILVEATHQVNGYKFRTEIVSNSDGEIDVIHKRIIQNIYNADIVICDISGKNPNVLFELGMRLAFDKPTIIIKDDATDFMFDTGVIEHLSYPKDLRFQKIVDFKKELALRIKRTYERSIQDSSFSTFLGNFGEFKVPNLKQTQVSDVEQIILEELSNIRTEFSLIKQEISTKRGTPKKLYTLSAHNLKEIIHSYVDTNPFNNKNAFGTPKDLATDKHFVTYLRQKGIDPESIPEEALLTIIEDVQQNALPF
ncbi:hypothetical protein BTO30_12680 [Domibacillus antri]|uniref:RNA helicase n=1 Tax=Domibacillus antri TaxID=1714264 RepID=A0A1Q8Q3G2_9BACI|nr:hypothetical protein [Domibacillus antri]OLN21867.1 hypothetical protein BTO30_12680 [Domibacillus antri]